MLCRVANLYVEVPAVGGMDSRCKDYLCEEDYIADLYEDSLENYKKYLEMSPNASDKEDVEAQIVRINGILNSESELNKD